MESEMTTPRETKKAISEAVVRAIGGRVTKDSVNEMTSMGGMIMPPVDAEDVWRLEKLDVQSFERMPPWKLLELLCELSPDISRALWDFLRMSNPGWELKAYRLGTQSIDPRAQAACDAFVIRLKELHGDFNIVANRLFIMAFMRGALFAELIMSADGRTAVDLVTPDPQPVRFEKVRDSARGAINVPFEWVNNEKVYLNLPTIKYIPVDPFPGSPYGRALASPALFSTLFLLALLHDIRRVVQQQGYPRMDIEIDLEAMRLSMPEDAEADVESWKNWVNEAVDQVTAMYSKLQPDEAYVHTNVVKLNRPMGTVDASSLTGIQGIIEVLERMSVRALKTVPIVHGQAQNVSESNANRQWEIYAAGVKALQHFAEVLLEDMFDFMLRAQGIQAKTAFRFSELRAAELLRDTQVDLLRVKVAKERYLAGYVSQDEAALYATGKEKADAQEPRDMQPVDDAGAGAAASAQPDPGSTRATWRLIHDGAWNTDWEISEGKNGRIIHDDNS
jgi:hypothetical protein